MDESPLPTDKPTPPETPVSDPNFWHIFALISVIVVSFITFSGFNLNPPRHLPPPPPRKLVPTPTQKPVNKYVPPPTPTISTSRTAPTFGTSPGVFFPYNQGVTINNPTPTIIGKISQSSGIFLSTKFGSEISPVSFEPGDFLRFIPGRVKNLKVTLDNQDITDIFGIAQYPTVHCMTQTTKPDGTSSYDPQTKQKIPPDILYTSESECIQGKRDILPALIFFAKVTTPLASGKHTLVVMAGGSRQTMDFYIKEDYHMASQNIYSINSQTDYQYPLMRSDTCMPGYYYDRDHLKFPLPDFKNPNLLYGLSFPQNPSENGSINRRGVQINFDGNYFDLFFPQYSVFYQNEAKTTGSTMYVDPFRELFLPKKQLIFSNGQKADYQTGDSTYVGSAYFEIHAIDLTGGQYRNSTIPFTLSGSSSCDG